MNAVAKRFEDLEAVALSTNWRGRSGRYYALEVLPLDHFALTGDALYVLAGVDGVLWVGTADEVIGDAASRSRFRVALAAAGSVYRTDLPDSEIDRLTLAWDLEGASPVVGLKLT